MTNIPTVSKLQIAYNDLEARKRKLADLRKQRQESILLDSEDFGRLNKKIDDAREARKKIELDFDQANPDLKDKIDSLAEEVGDLSDKLSMDALREYIKTGRAPELFKMKNGKKKKLVPQYKVAFKQETLF